MLVSIIDVPFNRDLYGFSGVAIDKKWKETGFVLMNKMWTQVKSRGLRNKGLNT